MFVLTLGWTCSNKDLGVSASWPSSGGWNSCKIHHILLPLLLLLVLLLLLLLQRLAFLAKLSIHYSTPQVLHTKMALESNFIYGTVRFVKIHKNNLFPLCMLSRWRYKSCKRFWNFQIWALIAQEHKYQSWYSRA